MGRPRLTRSPLAPAWRSFSSGSVYATGWFMQTDRADRRMEAGVARLLTRPRPLCPAREYPPLGAVLRNGFLIIRAVHNEHSGRSLFWLGWLPVQPALSGLTSRRAPILGQKRRFHLPSWRCWLIGCRCHGWDAAWPWPSCRLIQYPGGRLDVGVCRSGGNGGCGRCQVPGPVQVMYVPG